MEKNFEQRGQDLGKLVDQKQKGYGDAVATVEQIMMILYPDGIKPEQYQDALIIVRTLDKLCRIARGDKKAFGESPWKDIAGYGLLGDERSSRQ